MRCFLLIVFSLYGIVFGQGNLGLVWGPQITVANGSVYDNIRPQIAILDGNKPLVVWASNIGGNKGFVSTWDGTGFSSPFKLNPTGQINAYTAESPNIAAFGNMAYAVYTKSPSTSSAVFLVRSTDAGQTWEPPIWVDSLSSGIPNFAQVGVNQNGNPLVMYMRQSSTWANPRYVMRQSTDFGLTWLPEVEVSTSAPGGRVCDCCTGQIYSDAGKIVAVFRNNDGNLRDMWATTSSNGGLSFGSPTDLDTTDWVISACPMSGPQAHILGDSIYTAFMSQGANGLPRVFIGASNLQDSSFGWNRMLWDTTSQISQNYPTITGNGDTIIVAWLQSDGNNPEIVLRWSFSGPNGLFSHKPIFVSDWNNGTQTFPDVAWENGNLHIVWQDNATNTVTYRRASVGIEVAVEEPNISNFMILPNPSSGQFKILNESIEEITGWQLFDLYGRIVLENEGKVEALPEISAEFLPNGNYYLKIWTSEKKASFHTININH